MVKNPTGARFILELENEAKRPWKRQLQKPVIKQIQIDHGKSHFYSDYKKLWVVENSKPVTKQNGKTYLYFWF